MQKGKIGLLSIPVLVGLLTISLVSPLSFSSEIQNQELKIVDSHSISSIVTLTVFDEFGNVKQVEKNHNLITDRGLDEIAEAVFGVNGTGTTLFNFLDIGTSSTAPSLDNEGLVLPVGGACVRIQDIAPDVLPAITGETSVSVISSFAGNLCAGAIVETGIFNSVAGGEMLGRSTFGVVTITPSDTLQVNYTVTIT